MEETDISRENGGLIIILNIASEKVQAVLQQHFDFVSLNSELMSLFEKYYPFADPKKVPNLEEIIRWQIRRKLLVDNHIIFNDKVPLHIFRLLNYYN